MRLSILLLLALGAGLAHGQHSSQTPSDKPAVKTKFVTKHSKTVVKRKPARKAHAVASSAPALLYKTKGDYEDLVPVTLSDDRRSIVAYPAPGDISGHLPRPTALAQGYWLDNRGIGPNTAFLKLTYADYAQLSTAPSLADMEAMIMDRDPLTALCDCGPRAAYANPTADLNALIAAGRLPSRCKVLK
ncbi:MAG: hypothetical protein M3Y54_10635 [Bacteroidota bacterium]|nr:hypothetical protein [Bacteroidota bacterium]